MSQLQSKTYSKYSDRVLLGYIKQNKKLKDIEIYNLEDFINNLQSTNLDQYKGKSKQRTLLRDDIKLYKSILYYTDEFKIKYPTKNPKTYWVERLLICQSNLILSDEMLCLCKEKSSFNPTTQKFNKKFCNKCWIPPCSKKWFKYNYSENWLMEYEKFHNDEKRRDMRKRVGRNSWYIRKGRKFMGCLCKGKNETSILDFVEKQYNIILERGKQVDGYYVDGYCMNNNTVYEVYEHYHKYQEDYDNDRRINIMDSLKCSFVILYDNDDQNLEEITIKRYDKV